MSMGHAGSGKYGDKDAAAVRANRPIPPQAAVYYFEVTIMDKGKQGFIGKISMYSDFHFFMDTKLICARRNRAVPSRCIAFSLARMGSKLVGLPRGRCRYLVIFNYGISSSEVEDVSRVFHSRVKGQANHSARNSVLAMSLVAALIILGSL